MRSLIISGSVTVSVIAALLAGEPRPVPTSAAAAADDGKLHPRAPQPDSLPRVFHDVAGSPERICVLAPEPGIDPQARSRIAISPPVRSGDFVMGGQLAGSMRLTAGRAGKIWWAPLHNAWNHEEPLTIRGVLFGSPGDTVRFTFNTRAFNPGNKGEPFFPSGINLPKPGMWLLVATTGPDWGCVMVTTRP